LPTGERVGRTICGREAATRTTSSGLPTAFACAGEPALSRKCTHRSQCESSCERSVSPCAEYTAAQAISAQAATRASRRLRRKPVLKLGKPVDCTTGYRPPRVWASWGIYNERQSAHTAWARAGGGPRTA